MSKQNEALKVGQEVAEGRITADKYTKLSAGKKTLYREVWGRRSPGDKEWSVREEWLEWHNDFKAFHDFIKSKWPEDDTIQIYASAVSALSPVEAQPENSGICGYDKECDCNGPCVYLASSDSVEAQPVEETVEYYEKYDFHYRQMHRKLNDFLTQCGWKDLFYIILKFQSKKVPDSACQLINSVSDDYKRLVTKYCSPKDEELHATITAQQKEIADLKEALSDLVLFSDTWGREWFNQSQWDKIQNAKKALHHSPHHPNKKL